MNSHGRFKTCISKKSNTYFHSIQIHLMGNVILVQKRLKLIYRIYMMNSFQNESTFCFYIAKLTNVLPLDASTGWTRLNRTRLIRS